MNTKTFTNFVKTTRFKATLWYAFIFITLEISTALIIHYSLYNRMVNNLNQSLYAQAKAIKGIASLRKFDIQTIDRVGKDSLSVYTNFNSPEALVWDVIYDAVVFNRRNTMIQITYNDDIVYQSDNLLNEKIEYENSTVKDVPHYFSFDNKNLSPYRIRAIHLRSDIFDIIVAYPEESLEENLKILNEIYLIVMPLFFIVALIGGFYISAKALSRIDRIIDNTNEITAHNLNEKIQGEEFKDEYGRLVKTLNGMIRRINESMNYMKQFTISASHELKTPLTILQGEIELGLKTAKTADELRAILESNYDEVLQLTRIIENLFLLSKIDNSVIKLNKEDISLNDFIEEIIYGMSFIAKEKNALINFNPDYDVLVSIDKTLMKQVFYNLLENALKYSDSGESIAVSTYLEDDFVAIRVANKCKPIPQNLLNNIFDRFYRLESSRNKTHGGVGLGLSVVKSIVEMHQGSISVISNDEIGIMFETKLKI